MSADRAHNCHEVYIEQFIDEMGWLIDDLDLVLITLIMSWSLINLGPLGLYKEIYDARAPCTWLVHVLRHREYRLSNSITYN
jgi:hypothetical protein